IQADIFDAKIVRLSSEQGPGMGAAMLAAYGCGWFDSLKACAAEFLDVEREFVPNKANVKEYEKLFAIYQEVYGQTKALNENLLAYRE
ncbi:MAG TPA: xylulokinase, partial [Pseudogracilibacillus sp.]|nr:xylulokinase [Pseudogracilibacillus sp.]